MKRKKKSRQKREAPPSKCRLREIRKMRGLSITQLAHESGVPANSIIYIELGRGEGLPSTNLKLAKTLEVSLDEYFGVLKPYEAKEPEIILSKPHFTVEQISPLPGSELSLKRVHLMGRNQYELTLYLNPKKPVVFYLIQGDARLEINKEDYPMKAGDHLSLSRPGNIIIENLTNLTLTLLVTQP